MVNNIFLGLGSNKENRVNYLSKAISAFSNNENFKIETISSIYESEPYGYKNQALFLNVVVKISSSYALNELCSWIKNLEKEVGRQASFRWGPREIDIDILFYDDLIYSDEKLSVPHKEVLLRDFVLIPLQEIAADFLHPVLGIKINEIDTKNVEKLIINKFSNEIIKWSSVG